MKTKMKSFSVFQCCLLIISLISICEPLKGQWYSQTSGTINHLQSIYFTSTTSGITVGDNGTILRTTNGGTNWSQINSGTTASLSSVYFVNQNTGFAVGAGVILKTTNGGSTWTLNNSFASITFNSVHFPVASIGYAIGNQLVKTTDGGSTWSVINATVFGNSIFFTDANTGYIVGDACRIQKTTDGGITWITQYLLYAGPNLYSVFFPSSTVGYTVGSKLMKTTNGGSTWTELSNSFVGTNYSAFCTDINTCYLVSDNIYKTTNGGSTWTDQGFVLGCHSVCFANSEIGYACGTLGIIYKTTNGGGFPVGILDAPVDAGKLNIYPNPADDNITVETSILGAKDLTISDIEGRSLMNSAMSGSKITINVTNFKHGIYIVKISNGSTIEFEKIIKN